MYKYADKTYSGSQFQSIKITKSGAGYLYANLEEPYDILNEELIKKYSQIDSKRVIITTVDSCNYLIISSKKKAAELGLLSIYSLQGISNPVFNDRLILDSISTIEHKYYKNCLFAKELTESTDSFVNTMYNIPHCKYDDPIRKIIK